MKSKSSFDAFLDSLSNVTDYSTNDGLNPLVVDANVDGLPLKLVAYIFTCIDPPGGRPTGEYKISVCIPGQVTGDRCNFDFDTGFVLLVGYIRSFDVFVLWDAYKHRNFAYRSNQQVKQSTILNAVVDGMAVQLRKMRKAEGTETVICCTSRNLEKAIIQRYKGYIDDLCTANMNIVQKTLF